MPGRKKLMPGTGLAVMLAGFVIYISGFFAAPIASAADGPAPEDDSVILARHIREIKVAYALEEFSDHSFNAHLSDEEIDSILHANRIEITNASVHYSPDSAFKIFTVQGVECFIHCNPFGDSWLHFNDGSGMVLSHAGYEDLSGITALPGNQYLLRQTSWGIGGTYSVEQYSVSLLKINDHEITKIPFVQNNMDSTESFTVWQPNYVTSDFYLDYIDSSGYLNYQYGNDLDPATENDSVTIYTGHFRYENGAFVHKEESAKRMFVNMH